MSQAGRVSNGWKFFRLVFVATCLGACGSPAATTQRPTEQVAAAAVQPTARPTIAPSPTVRPTPRPTATPQVAASGDVLFIAMGAAMQTNTIALVDADTGASQRHLPIGLATSDWSTLYVVESDTKVTTVRAVAVATGATLRETRLEGDYALPVVGSDGSLGGLSPDGRWLTLATEADAASTAGGTRHSRFAVLSTGFISPPRLVDLDGVFWFDAIDNSGNALYLTETPQTDQPLKYQVRYYNLTEGALDPQVVVTKGESEVMEGTRQAAVPSARGDQLYSLYLNTEHGPFIHALDVTNRFAVCIDLPTNAKGDLAKQRFWSLVRNPHTGRLFAVNGMLGLVSEISPDQYAIVRTVTLPATSAQSVPLGGSVRLFAPAAKEPRAIRGSLTLSPDGKTLFAVGAQGVMAIDTGTLTLRGQYLQDMAVESISVSPDGARLYAVRLGQPALLVVDATRGTLLSQIPLTSAAAVLHVGTSP